MRTTLLIVSEKTNYFFPFVRNENIIIDDCWDKCRLNKYRKIYTICNRLQIPTAAFFGKWAKQLQEFSQIIIFDGCFNLFLKCYLDRRVPNTPKYVFCWNPRQRWENAIYSINRGRRYPLYSYSLADSKVLGIYHQSTFYTKDIHMPIEELKYDWIFVGRTKQRDEWIDKIYKWSKDNEISFFYMYAVQKKRHFL